MYLLVDKVLFYFYIFKIIIYYYSITVVPVFPPLPSYAHPMPHSHSQSPHCGPCLWVIHTCSLSSLPLLSTIIPLNTPLWSLSVCFTFPYLWAFLFVSLFCSLDSFYRWDHYKRTNTMVFVFHQLEYFT